MKWFSGKKNRPLYTCNQREQGRVEIILAQQQYLHTLLMGLLGEIKKREHLPETAAFNPSKMTFIPQPKKVSTSAS